MQIEAVVGGPRAAVGYLVYERPGGDCTVIDAPPGSTDVYRSLMEHRNLTATLIVSTHGHWEQSADLVPLRDATAAPVCAHAWDMTRLSEPRIAVEDESEVVPQLPSCRPDRLVHDGEMLGVGGLEFEVLHTPGHTPGSICLYEAKWGALFVGDLLTRNAVGRADVPGGNERQLLGSLARLLSFPAGTHVYPGHGLSTTLKAERWLLELAQAG
jgi:glyoxylase-like metal-dependent hydrolase (beta-lactamase superfamily II)